MKLIIDIPEEYYDGIRQISEETSTADMLIIKNGKPLDDELQEIRQKISDIQTEGFKDAHTMFIRTNDQVKI